MPIRVDCPQCETGHHLADALAGKKIKCKNCQHVFRLPKAEVEEVVEAVASPPAKAREAARPRPRPAAVQDEEDELPPRRPSPSRTRPAKTGRSRLARNISTLYVAAILFGVIGGALFAYAIGTAATSQGPKSAGPPKAEVTLVLLGLSLSGIGGLSAIFAGLLTLIWIGRSWNCVPAEDGGMSGAKAVLLMFVPLFNIYWMFRVVPGLSTALTRALERRDPDTPAATGYGAGLAACIMSLIGLNVLALVPFLMWLGSADRAVNRVLALEAPGEDAE
jgi:hypothetical protein